MAVNLAFLVLSYYPAYSTVQYIARRDEQGLNRQVDEGSEAVAAEKQRSDGDSVSIKDA
jgi:hypothetical protein